MARLIEKCKPEEKKLYFVTAEWRFDDFKEQRYSNVDDDDMKILKEVEQFVLKLKLKTWEQQVRLARLAIYSSLPFIYHLTFVFVFSVHYFHRNKKL